MPKNVEQPGNSCIFYSLSNAYAYAAGLRYSLVLLLPFFLEVAYAQNSNGQFLQVIFSICSVKIKMLSK